MEPDYKIVHEPRKDRDYTPDENIFYDMVIIGAGVVGLSAAMYAGRLGLKTLVIGELTGGTITKTHVVENYPGFVSITGQGLARVIEKHAKDYDVHFMNARVENLEAHSNEDKKHFKVQTKKKTFFGKTIIFATGSKWRKLNIPGEKEFENKGVSYCALCDGAFFKGKILGIVGGSDSAVKESLLLTEFAEKVYIIYRGENVRAEPINLERMNELQKAGKIEVINNTNVLEIKGDEMITHVVLDKPFNGKKELELGGLFVDIGHIPLSDLAIEIGAETNQKGEVLINRNSETNIQGFYAAGDITDTQFKQAITGVGEAVTAVYHAYDYVKNNEFTLSLGDERD